MKQGYTFKYDSGGAHVELGAAVEHQYVVVSLVGRSRTSTCAHQYFAPLPVYETCENEQGVE
jgi:hypothetical protein